MFDDFDFSDFTDLLGAAAPLASAGIGAYTAMQGQEAQLDALRQAQASQGQYYLQQRADYEPWRLAGVGALSQLQDMIKAGPGEFEESPDYQFRLGEGQKALERSASARGRQYSGAQMRAQQDLGQNMASQEYDRFLGRYYDRMRPLQSLAGLGQTAASGQAQAASSYGNNLANIATGMGQARASGYQGVGSAVSAGLGGLAENMATADIFNRFAPRR